MEAAPENDRPKLYLVRSTIPHMYAILNGKGQEVSPYKRFDRDWEAIEWANNYVSSWLTVELICFPEQLKSNA